MHRESTRSVRATRVELERRDELNVPFAEGTNDSILEMVGNTFLLVPLEVMMEVDRR